MLPQALAFFRVETEAVVRSGRVSIFSIAARVPTSDPLQCLNHFYAIRSLAGRIKSETQTRGSELVTRTALESP